MPVRTRIAGCLYPCFIRVSSVACFSCGELPPLAAPPNSGTVAKRATDETRIRQNASANAYRRLSLSVFHPCFIRGLFFLRRIAASCRPSEFGDGREKSHG